MEERSEELRLALVLNGGVSLAVWMGGVAFELNRLVRETHPVYRGLLRLTDTTARIDVISGTSAGGINGAALALARLYDRSLYALRDVWLDTAGLQDLLHEPDDPVLNSLMRGDEWFLPRIRDALAELASKGKPASPDQVPLNLTLTATLLDGERHVSLDDFGAEIEDKVHRAVWRFPHLPDDDVFGEKSIIDQLSFAARATASFPVAFEPALYNPDSKAFGGRKRLEARTSPPRKVTRKSFLLDGGILDNKPFEAALDAISKLPAEGNTRRVLAYIVPDPAAQADERLVKNGILQSPTIAQAAWRSLVSIPGSQSIASHMSELRAHNDEASSRWRRVVGAVVHIRAEGLMPSAAASLGAYKARRVDGIIEYFLEATERGLARVAATAADQKAAGAKDKAEPEVMQMRRSTRLWLVSMWRATARPAVGSTSCANADGLEKANQDLLAAIELRWRSRIPVDIRIDEVVLDRPWAWGRYTLQFMTEFATEVLRRTQRLYVLVDRWQSDAEAGGTAKAVVDGPEFPRLPSEDTKSDEPAVGGKRKASKEYQPDQDEVIGLDLAPDLAPPESELHKLPGNERGSRLKGSQRLKPMWSAAYATATKVQGRRLEFDALAEATGREGFIQFVDAWKKLGGESPPLDSALALLDRLMFASEEPEDLRALAREICEVFIQLQVIMKEIDEAHHKRGAGRADIDEAVCELRAIHAYLFDEIPSSEKASGHENVPDMIVRRLLALEVFELSASNRRKSQSAQAEIVQISGRLSSAFGGAEDPAKKLNGMQLAHFGAFYKRSWRANDWTFGCLDGIDRAIRIALNPEALQKRYGNRRVNAGGVAPVAASDYVREYIYALAVATAGPKIREELQSQWDAEEQKIRDELVWLDMEQTVPPPVLEHSAKALTRRIQLETLRREIPAIAHSLMRESATGAPPSREVGAPLLVDVAQGGRKLVPPPPKVAIKLVQSNLLGSENLKLQLGTDLLTRTFSQGLATAHSALSSTGGGLNALKALFKVTEWPIRIFYWLASRLSQPSSTSAALEAIAFGVGAAIIVAAGMSEKLSAPVLTFGWALLFGAVATSLLRDRKTGVLLVFAFVIALVLANQMTLGSIVLVIAGVVAAFLLLLSPLGAGIAALAVIGLAAWWSAGASVDAAALMSRGLVGWPELTELAKDPKREAEAKLALNRLDHVFWPSVCLGVTLVALAVLRSIESGFERIRRMAGMSQ